MVPLPFRLFVSAAALLVPRSKRREWKREWEAELWHRAETGASTEELFRCAAGVFRDAAWFRENERKLHGSDLFRKPLRTEAIFLGLALLACVISGAFNPPHRPFANAAQLVVFERNVAFPAAINQLMNPKLLSVSEDRGLFTGVAGYQILRSLSGLIASRNFFDVLGSQPLLGRTFLPSDPADVIVISYDAWRSRFHSDPQLIGKRKLIGRAEYTVIGIMPREFWFLSSRLQYFAPFPRFSSVGGAVARLAPGASVNATQDEVRRISRTLDPKWVSQSLLLIPLLHDSRPSEILFALTLALIAAALGMGFLIVKRLGGPRYWFYLGARVYLTTLGLCLIRMNFSLNARNGAMSHSLFVFWIFLLVCCAATCLLTIDHRQRCPVCLRRLHKPVAIGSWSSQILDQPATEYLCPAGHGTLYIAETGNAPDHWTVLDESWQDLFAHTE